MGSGRSAQPRRGWRTGRHGCVLVRRSGGEVWPSGPGSGTIGPSPDRGPAPRHPGQQPVPHVPVGACLSNLRAGLANSGGRSVCGCWPRCPSAASATGVVPCPPSRRIRSTGPGPNWSPCVGSSADARSMGWTSPPERLVPPAPTSFSSGRVRGCTARRNGAVRRADGFRRPLPAASADDEHCRGAAESIDIQPTCIDPVAALGTPRKRAPLRTKQKGTGQ